MRIHSFQLQLYKQKFPSLFWMIAWKLEQKYSSRKRAALNKTSYNLLSFWQNDNIKSYATASKVSTLLHSRLRPILNLRITETRKRGCARSSRITTNMGKSNGIEDVIKFLSGNRSHDDIIRSIYSIKKTTKRVIKLCFDTDFLAFLPA